MVECIFGIVYIYCAAICFEIYYLFPVFRCAKNYPIIFLPRKGFLCSRSLQIPLKI